MTELYISKLPFMLLWLAPVENVESKVETDDIAGLAVFSLCLQHTK